MRGPTEPFRLLVCVFAGLAIGVVSLVGASGDGVAAASARGAVHVSQISGTATSDFTANGTGCRGALVTYRIDGGGPNPAFSVGPSGVWSHTFMFPPAVGRHRFTLECHTRSTAGAPTTAFNLPGELRFRYRPFIVVTHSSAPVANPATLTTRPVGPGWRDVKRRPRSPTLVGDPDVIERHSALTLYRRQSHDEADLEALADASRNES